MARIGYRASINLVTVSMLRLDERPLRLPRVAVVEHQIIGKAVPLVHRSATRFKVQPLSEQVALLRSSLAADNVSSLKRQTVPLSQLVKGRGGEPAKITRPEMPRRL